MNIFLILIINFILKKNKIINIYRNFIMNNLYLFVIVFFTSLFLFFIFTKDYFIDTFNNLKCKLNPNIKYSNRDIQDLFCNCKSNFAILLKDNNLYVSDININSKPVTEIKYDTYYYKNKKNDWVNKDNNPWPYEYPNPNKCNNDVTFVNYYTSFIPLFYGTLTYPPDWFDWYNWKGWYPDENPFKKSKQEIKKQVDNKEIIKKQVFPIINKALTENRKDVEVNEGQLKPINKIEDNNSPNPMK